jgi:hypothetical protein
MILGQVSLSGGTVQTMCKDQFGNWITGCVELIALIGACLDVFWFDPRSTLLGGVSRFLARLLFKLASECLRCPFFFVDEYHTANYKRGFLNAPEVDES